MIQYCVTVVITGLLFGFLPITTFSQGISIGSVADINLNVNDGHQLPYSQYVEFNLGVVKGGMLFSLNGYFSDSDETPYISRFQDYINMYRTSSPTAVDYRHINENEIVLIALSGIDITDDFEIYVEGLSGRMLKDVHLLLETKAGNNAQRLIGSIDNNYYHALDHKIHLTEGDTLSIRTLSGQWRFQSLTLLFVARKHVDNPFKYIKVPVYTEKSYLIESFGRYYLEGVNPPDNFPAGLVAFVVGSNNDTIRYNGKYKPESEQFLLDLGILRLGDKVTVFYGTNNDNDPLNWNISLLKKPYYYSSHYSDPEELPLALASPLDQLEIFKYGHPRVFSFRNDYLGQKDYERFYTTVVQAQGAAPKTLAEERKLSSENLPKMQQLAKEHPEKIILNHFSFDGAMVEYIPESYDFFSKEHWCYFPGTYLTDFLKAEDEIALVETSSRFNAPNSDGTAFSNDVIILLPLDSLGNKQWGKAEFAAIKEIEDYKIHLTRGLFRTQAGNYSQGTYVAPVFSHSGWNMAHDQYGYRADETYFFYNWSADAPLDSLGRNCGDAFVEFYSNFLKEGGVFERFHGILADVWRGNNLVQPPYQSQIFSRSIDYNVNGQVDHGFDERGFNTLQYGLYDFARKFRIMLGSQRIWTADGNGAHWPRAIPFLSGIESEGFSYHHDAYLKGWSGAINRFSFYKNNLSQPWQFNIAVPKILDYQEAWPSNIVQQQRLIRLARAATTIMGLNNCANGVKTGMHAPDFWIADDFVMGIADTTQWLGFPVGNIIRFAQDTDDLLNGDGIALNPSFVGAWSSMEADITSDGDALIIQGKEQGLGHTQERMTISIPIQAPDGDLFIRFLIKADSLGAYAADMPRFFFVTANGLLSTDWTWKTLEGMAGSRDYEEMTFYYRQAGPAAIRLDIEFEGFETVWIKDFTLHNAQDIMAREFENGVVLVNPSKDSFLVNLSKLFPEQLLSYYKGNEYEDFLGFNNTGNPIQGPISLNAHRGLFLIKNKMETVVNHINHNLKINLYPVPASNQLHLDIYTQNDSTCQVNIIDMQGKIVKSVKLDLLYGK